ncbi:hypothetical protein [Motiliproteus sp. MSK22-1]|uniref:hypothetical protein n=1 Tax=Motiliproteus sp. MSK22-1 TaxID=1897630 RepID=UPI0009786F1B|nr:hypothetical protein [Motiliproteus sp. MSK22-1]OMH25618.1 hypothetical protein BGP75_24020 [Motiliproteus sp. MSK22-1]
MSIDAIGRQLDRNVATAQRSLKDVYDGVDGATVEDWNALIEAKGAAGIAGKVRDTEFQLKFGLAKSILNEIR